MAKYGSLLTLSASMLFFNAANARPSQGVVDDFSSLKAEFTLPCLIGRAYLVDEPNSPIVLDSDELERRAIRTTRVVAPAGTAAPETLTVYIVIGVNGRVICANVTDQTKAQLGKTAILAIEAAKKWIFQPVLHHTRPVICIGHLDLEVVR